MSEPEPSVASPEPSSEPRFTSSPESFPEGEPGIHGGQNHLPNSEPEVNISEVGEAWRVVFKVHWIGFASCFALLALITAVQLYKTYRRKRIRNRVYILAVQQLVILLGISRVLALCLWPYDLYSNVANLPQVIPRLLFGLGFPCLFSGLTFVHKIFLKVSEIQILSSRTALKRRVMLVILVVHVLAVLAAEVVTSYVKGTGYLLIVCGFYYLTGCMAISFSLLYSGRKVIKRTRQVEDNLNGYRLNVELTNQQTFSKDLRRKATGAGSKVLKITATAVVFGFLSSLLYVYVLVWMFRDVLGDTASPSPWVWITVMTCVRFCELFLAIIMSYAVSSGYQGQEN